MRIPYIQQYSVHVEFHGSIIDSLPHDLWREIICTVQRDEHATVNLLVNSGQLVEMYLSRSWSRGPVVTVDVTDRWG